VKALTKDLYYADVDKGWVPLARMEYHFVADYLEDGGEMRGARWVRGITDGLLHRHMSPYRRGDDIHDPMTAFHVQAVIDLKRAHPNWTQEEIGRVLNIGAGRVSEVFSGARTVENPSGKRGDMRRPDYIEPRPRW